MVQALSRVPGLRHRAGAVAQAASGAVPPALVVSLDDPRAADPEVSGRKAATLARARRLGFPVLPGFVVTTSAAEAIQRAGGTTSLPPAVRSSLEQSWSSLSGDGTRPVVVRSSSPGEDGATSSMAGQFTSVLGVRTRRGFFDAVDEVIESAHVIAVDDGGAGGYAPMAVLVQPQVFPAWGGVLFGLDPVSGRTDRLVVAAVRSGPDQLVSGTVAGSRSALSPRGRFLAHEGVDDRLPRPHRRALARLAARAARAFGGPQDIEWGFDEGGELILLQSRPVTAVGAVAPVHGPVLGPGPVAETFPDPLTPLEADLWLEPLRAALSEAVLLTGAASPRRVKASPVIASVGGRAAADLTLLGAATSRPSLLARLDPRPPARRVRAAWRTGRLRAALPGLARDLLERADQELASVPHAAPLPDDELMATLRGSRQALVALHGYEVLAGMLSQADPGASTSAAAALRALAAAREDGLDDATAIAVHPVVLSLVPPAIGPATPLPAVAVVAPPRGDRVPDELSAAREALRLRVRWTQELGAKVAWELGCRLARRDLLPDAGAVRWLSLEELGAAVARAEVPDGLEGRRLAPTSAPLPAAFRLTASGAVVPVQARPHGGGQGAGGGRAMGRVQGEAAVVEAGAVLVVRTLDPGLAAVLPLLGGLVAETGSVLSHLAILARELGVPTVVGVADAVTRFPPGSVVVVDGTTGEVSAVEARSRAA